MPITDELIAQIIESIKSGDSNRAINLARSNVATNVAAAEADRIKLIVAISSNAGLAERQKETFLKDYLNPTPETKAEFDSKNETPPATPVEQKRGAPTAASAAPVEPTITPPRTPPAFVDIKTPSINEKSINTANLMRGETGWGPFAKKTYESHEDSTKLLKNLTLDEQVDMFVVLMNSEDKQATPALFNSLGTQHKKDLINAAIKSIASNQKVYQSQVINLMMRSNLSLEDKRDILFKLSTEERGRIFNLMDDYGKKEFIEFLPDAQRKDFISHINPDAASALLFSLASYPLGGLKLAKKLFAEQGAEDSNFQIYNVMALLDSSRRDVDQGKQKIQLITQLLDQSDVSTEQRAKVFNGLQISDAVRIFREMPANRTTVFESSFDRKLKLLSSESLRDSDGLRLAMFDGLKPEEKDYMISDSRMPEHLSVKFFQSELAKQKDKPEYLKQFFNDMLGAKTTKRALALFNNIKTVDKDGIQVPDYNLQAETLKRLPQHRAADFFRGVKDYNKQAELLMAVESKDPRLAQPLFKRLESAAQQAHVLQKIYTTGNDKSSSAYHDLSQKLFNNLNDSKNQPNFQQQAKILDEMLDFDVRDKLFKNLAETNPKQAAKVLNQGTLSSLIGNDKKIDLFKTLDSKTQKEVLNAQENGKHHLSDKNSKKLFTAMNINTKAEHLTDLMKSDLPRPKMLFSSVKAKEQADILAELAKSNNKNNASDLFQSVNSTKRQIEILNNLNNPDLRDHLIKSLEPKQAADLFNSAFSTLKDRDAIFSKLVKEDPSRAIQILDSSSSFTGSGKTLFKKYIDSLSEDDAVKEAKNLLSQVKDKKKYFDCLPIPIKMKLGADKSFVSEFGSKNMGGFDQTHNSISLQTCVKKGVPREEAVQTLVGQPPSQSRPGMSPGI